MLKKSNASLSTGESGLSLDGFHDDIGCENSAIKTLRRHRWLKKRFAVAVVLLSPPWRCQRRRRRSWQTSRASLMKTALEHAFCLDPALPESREVYEGNHQILR